MARIVRSASDSSAEMTIREFIRIEKNLTTLGFLHRRKDAAKSSTGPKVIRIRREMQGGKVVEAEATIIPSVEHGLPTTPDQDKYLAFQQIVQEKRKANGGRVQNPIPFTSYEFCRRVGLNTGGKNYADIGEWLDRMVATTIRSKGTVYLAKRKTYVKDTFHVFDRVIMAGEELSDGRIAEQNYVWLSEWQIDNLNERYQLPVDFDCYKQLRTHIGKALVPLLQVWLFPTQSAGKFEKRYSDVCELLSLRPQNAPSLIDRQLRPALEELVKMGYISNWSVLRTADNLDYKLTLFHGPKYLNDLLLLSSKRSEDNEGAVSEVSPELLQKLIQRGMSARSAKRLLEIIPSDQQVEDQLEWCDAIILRGRIDNPAGFIYSVLKNNEPVPESFETTENRNARLKKQHEDLTAYAHLEQEQQYERYIEELVTNAVADTYATDDYEGALKRVAVEIRKQYPNVPDSTIRELSEARVRQDVRASLALISFNEFTTRKQYPLFS